MTDGKHHEEFECVTPQADRMAPLEFQEVLRAALAQRKLLLALLYFGDERPTTPPDAGKAG